MTANTLSELKYLTDDEKCVMHFINGAQGPTTLVIGGTDAESVLSHRAALAMLSLIGRGMITANTNFENGHTSYHPTEVAQPLRGKVSAAFVKRHGGWSLTVPQSKKE